jgi:IPT/TIG domain
VHLVAHGSASAQSLRETLSEPAAPRRHEHEQVRPRPGSASGADGALQTSPLGTHSPLVSSSFNGLTNNDNTGFAWPPDTVGDVGPSNYVEMTNNAWAVYGKTGTKLAGPFDNNVLWAGLPSGLCKTHDDGDPIVVYDSIADRWVLTQFAVPVSGTTGGFHECIAVSKTSNPAGAYWAYDYLVSGTLFDDYPKLGVWPDGYYMSFNDFGHSFAGVTVAAFPRTQLLKGVKQNGIEFTPTQYPAGSDSFSMLPADSDGHLPPPAGTPEIFAQYQTPPIVPSERLSLFAFHADFATPANSTFRPLANLNTAPFIDQFCAEDCIPQKGTTQGLDDLSDRLLQRLSFRNYGNGAQALVVDDTVQGKVAQATPTYPTAAVRWYELRRHTGANWSIYQQGTYQPDASGNIPLSRWMGSAAMDGTHDLAVGYSASSRVAYPSIRYAARTPADPLGKLEAETTLYQGGGAQINIDRWGDYTAMSVDPADDCTFWYLGEYYTSADSSDWHTRIGSFRVPSCFGISQISPGSGLRGSTVTITGIGFTSSAVVKFNGVSASKTFVNSQKLTALVPSTATTGRVTVTQGTNTVYSAAVFRVTG